MASIPTFTSGFANSRPLTPRQSTGVHCTTHCMSTDHRPGPGHAVGGTSGARGILALSYQRCRLTLELRLADRKSDGPRPVGRLQATDVALPSPLVASRTSARHDFAPRLMSREPARSSLAYRGGMNEA